MRIELAEILAALRAVQGQHFQHRRKAGNLGLPVRNQAGRHHDQRGLFQRTALFQCEQMGDQLQRLAQAHVVGQHAAHAGLGQRIEPAQAFALVGAQFDGESIGHDIAGAFGGIAQARGESAQGLRRLQFAIAGQRLGQLFQPAGLHARQVQFPFRFFQVFGQRREQATQFAQAYRHAAAIIHRGIPDGILGFVGDRPQVELMIGQRLRYRRQQVVALAFDLDADFQVEGMVVGIFYRVAVPMHRAIEHFEREAGRVVELEVFALELRPQGQPTRGRIHFQRAGMALARKQPGIIRQGVGQVPRQAFGIHGGSQPGAFELLHRGQFFGATPGDLDQLTVAHASHQRLAAAAGQALAGIVEGQPGVGQRRRARSQAGVAGQCVQGEHGFRRQFLALQFTQHLRRGYAMGEPAVRQRGAQPRRLVVFQRRQVEPVAFFGRGLEVAQLGALGVEIPQRVQAQRALAVSQRRQQALAAILFQLPVPVELMRTPARQAQATQAAKEARRGIQHLGQQCIADMASQVGVAAPLAQGLRQAQHGGRQALLVGRQGGARQQLAVQRHRPHEAAVLGHAERHRRHVQPPVRRAFVRQHLEEETEHARLARSGGDGRRSQQLAPRHGQPVAAGAGRGGLAEVFLVRWLHADAIRGR